MKRILFVDDEINILTALRRSLRSQRNEWDMVFAEGGAAALEQLASAPFDVVVSDAQMAGMNGCELLGEVLRLYPDTVRIILSGQCSRNSALKCVGVAHQFLSKPCEPGTLKSAVQTVCAMRDSFDDKPTRTALSCVQWLPSQATVYSELAHQVESPEASIECVAETIARDVAMCARVVQLVSSGFFGSPQRVTTAARAANLLGLETIQALLASSAVFRPRREECQEEDLRMLTDHSLAVAAAAEQIAETMTGDRTLIGDAHLAGMLHEVGTLALAARCDRSSSETHAAAIGQEIARWRNPEACARETWPNPGGYLVALWGLPDPVAQAIGYHHSPTRCPEQTFGPLTAVHVADTLLGPPWGPLDEGVAPLDLDYLRSIGCTDRLESWRAICQAAVPEEVY